jgi:hypothetical protein
MLQEFLEPIRHLISEVEHGDDILFGHIKHILDWKTTVDSFLEHFQVPMIQDISHEKFVQLQHFLEQHVGQLLLERNSSMNSSLESFVPQAQFQKFLRDLDGILKPMQNAFSQVQKDISSHANALRNLFDSLKNIPSNSLNLPEKLLQFAQEWENHPARLGHVDVFSPSKISTLCSHISNRDVQPLKKAIDDLQGHVHMNLENLRKEFCMPIDVFFACLYNNDKKIDEMSIQLNKIV